MNKTQIIEKLEFFNSKVTRLKNTNFIAKLNEGSSVTIKGSLNHPVEIVRKGPGQEEIDAFVMTYRFFIQDNEGISIRKMAELYNNPLINQDFRDRFQDARNKLNTFIDSSCAVNNLPFRRIQDIFIYGSISHANSEKQRIYNEWMSLGPFKFFFENELVYVLGTVMHFLNYFYNLNSEVLIDLKDSII